jgi:hypothetical protein
MPPLCPCPENYQDTKEDWFITSIPVIRIFLAIFREKAPDTDDPLKSLDGGYFLIKSFTGTCA